MNEEQALAEVVQTLTIDHGCHAVILYGSRVRGTLLQRFDALDRQGPSPLPEGENEMVHVWYAKMLARIAGGDLESKYRRVERLYQVRFALPELDRNFAWRWPLLSARPPNVAASSAAARSKVGAATVR